MHLSWSWSYTDHVTLHALIAWLIMHWSRGWSCTDHMPDHTLITWVIMHSSRAWSCTDYVAEHALINVKAAVASFLRTLQAIAPIHPTPPHVPDVLLNTLYLVLLCYQSISIRSFLYQQTHAAWNRSEVSLFPSEDVTPRRAVRGQENKIFMGHNIFSWFGPSAIFNNK